VASYIGMIPDEPSGGMRQRVRKTEQGGNALLHYLSTEAAMHVVRKDPELKRFYRRKLIPKGMGKARVAAGRKTGDPAVDYAARPSWLPTLLPRGKLRQEGEAHVGTPAFNSGPAL
jgi:Transposase IS116/IS110/IS902 family